MKSLNKSPIDNKQNSMTNRTSNNPRTFVWDCSALPLNYMYEFESHNFNKEHVFWCSAYSPRSSFRKKDEYKEQVGDQVVLFNSTKKSDVVYVFKVANTIVGKKYIDAYCSRHAHWLEHDRIVILASSTVGDVLSSILISALRSTQLPFVLINNLQINYHCDVSMLRLEKTQQMEEIKTNNTNPSDQKKNNKVSKHNPTKIGDLYVLKMKNIAPCYGMQYLTKIGKSLGSGGRVKSLRTGNPFDLYIYAHIRGADYALWETVSHKYLSNRNVKNKLNGGSEWFALTDSELRSFINMMKGERVLDFEINNTIDIKMYEQKIMFDAVQEDHNNLKQRTRLKADLTVVRGKYKDSCASIAELKTTIDNHQAKIDMLKVKHVERDIKIVKLNTELDRVRSESRSKDVITKSLKKQYKEIIVQLENDVKTANSRVDYQQQELAVQKEEINRLTLLLTSKEQEEKNSIVGSASNILIQERITTEPMIVKSLSCLYLTNLAIGICSFIIGLIVGLFADI